MHYYTSTATETATITLLMPDGTTYTTSGSIHPAIEARRRALSAQPAQGSLSAATGLSYVLDSDLAALTSGVVLATMPYSGYYDNRYGYRAYITWESPSGEDHVTAATVDYGESITGHVLLIEGDYSYFSDGTKDRDDNGHRAGSDRYDQCFDRNQ